MGPKCDKKQIDFMWKMKKPQGGTTTSPWYNNRPPYLRPSTPYSLRNIKD